MPALGKKHGGRTKGTPNKRTAERAAKIAEGGQLPLEFLLAVMRDESVPRAERIDAAKAAAPYVHPRLQTIQHVGEGGGPIKTQEVNMLEVARRMAFILSAAANEVSGEQSNGQSA